MKITLSISDDVFASAEKLARRAKKSRSRIFSEAMREFVARHASDDVTEAMDRVGAELGGDADRFVEVTSRRVLKRSEW